MYNAVAFEYTRHWKFPSARGGGLVFFHFWISSRASEHFPGPQTAIRFLHPSSYFMADTDRSTSGNGKRSSDDNSPQPSKIRKLEHGPERKFHESPCEITPTFTTETLASEFPHYLSDLRRITTSKDGNALFNYSKSRDIPNVLHQIFQQSTPKMCIEYVTGNIVKICELLSDTPNLFTDGNNEMAIMLWDIYRHILPNACPYPAEYHVQLFERLAKEISSRVPFHEMLEYAINSGIEISGAPTDSEHFPTWMFARLREKLKVTMVHDLIRFVTREARIMFPNMYGAIRSMVFWTPTPDDRISIPISGFYPRSSLEEYVTSHVNPDGNTKNRLVVMYFTGNLRDDATKVYQSMSALAKSKFTSKDTTLPEIGVAMDETSFVTELDAHMRHHMDVCNEKFDKIKQTNTNSTTPTSSSSSTTTTTTPTSQVTTISSENLAESTLKDLGISSYGMYTRTTDDGTEAYTEEIRKKCCEPTFVVSQLINCYHHRNWWLTCLCRNMSPTLARILVKNCRLFDFPHRTQEIQFVEDVQFRLRAFTCSRFSTPRNLADALSPYANYPEIYGSLLDNVRIFYFSMDYYRPFHDPIELRNEEESKKKVVKDGEPPKCIVCWERERTIAVIPCGHYIYCRECFEIINSSSDNACSICRKPIQGHTVIFVS